MNAPAQDATTRTIFLDNIRTWMVLIVIVFHVALGYGSISLWPVYDPPRIVVADWIYWIGDVFMMAILFFVAGYFSVPSISRRGTASFLKRKAIRLLVPCFLVTLLLNPICMYLWHYTNDFTLHLGRMSYWAYWGEFLRDGFQARIATASIREGIVTHYSLFHCWFLTVLMVFFLAFALWYRLFGRLTRVSTTPEPTPVPQIKRWLIGGSLVAAFLIGLIMLAGRIPAWFMIGPILSFEFPNVVLYTVYFAIGVVAYRQRWFDQPQSFGSSAVWTGVCLLMCVPYLFMMHWMVENPSTFESPWFLTLHWCYRVFFCLAFLGAFITVGLRYANGPSRFNRVLAENSYKMYLLHMIVVILLQWGIWYWDGGSTYIKLIVISLLSIPLTYLVAISIPNRFELTPNRWSRQPN